MTDRPTLAQLQAMAHVLGHFCDQNREFYGVDLHLALAGLAAYYIGKGINDEKARQDALEDAIAFMHMILAETERQRVDARLDS